MKKHSLFKVILIVLGALVCLNGLFTILGLAGVKAFESFKMIPIGDVFLNFVQSFYYFFDTLVFLMVLGAFYAVLNKIPAYKKLVDNIAQKVKAHSKLFVFIVTILFAILTSATGLVNVLMVFVPFVIAIILLLGYDKLVAISSTIVAMLVGFMGGVFVTFRDANSYYGYASTTFTKFAGVKMYANLVPQLIILVLCTALLILFINKYIKSVQDKKVKYELNDSDEVIVSEVKGDYKTIKTWPIIVILALIFVILVLGYMPWNDLFGIKCFDKFDEWLKGLSIGEFAVIPSILSGYLYSFGSWASLGSYMCIIITLIIFTIIIKFIYRVKFDELVEDFMSGAKKMIPMVFLVAISYAILVCTYNFEFISNFITLIGDKLGMNLVTSSLLSVIGTLFHGDLYYTTTGVFANINSLADESLLSTYAMTYQSIYGLVSAIAPTSLLVIFALKYFDVPYTSWVKYIWRFVLMLFLLVILVLLVLSLI